MSVRRFEDANIAIYKIQSAGAAYDLTLPFDPDMIEWWNATLFGSDDSNISGVWIKGLPDGDALIVARGTTTLTSTLETTNGLTVLDDGSGFADNHRTPTAITAASPPVVTSNGHGLSNGQYVRATNFITSPVGDATGMEQLNNLLFLVGQVTANTFALFDAQTGEAIDATGYTAFVNNGIAQFTLTGESLNTQNPAPVFQVTLGSEIMGSDNDIIYVRATKANVYTNLGDVA